MAVKEKKFNLLNREWGNPVRQGVGQGVGRVLPVALSPSL
jgi:hypothetical protein